MNNRRSSLLFCFPITSRFACRWKKPSVECNVWRSINTKLSTTFFGVKTKQTGKKICISYDVFARKHCYHYFKSGPFGHTVTSLLYAMTFLQNGLFLERVRQNENSATYCSGVIYEKIESYLSLKRQKYQFPS